MVMRKLTASVCTMPNQGAAKNLVIMLHGFPEFWYAWQKQLIALSEEFHVVAPDMRGYNLSEKPPRVEDYRIEKLVADVIGLIDHFGAKQAAIVGHDWGGGVAWAIAQKYPSNAFRNSRFYRSHLRRLGVQISHSSNSAELVHVLLPNSSLAGMAHEQEETSERLSARFRRRSAGRIVLAAGCRELQRGRATAGRDDRSRLTTIAQMFLIDSIVQENKRTMSRARRTH